MENVALFSRIRISLTLQLTRGDLEMKKCTVFALAISALILIGLIPTAEAQSFKTTYDPSVLAAVCRLQGGEYFPPSTETQGGFGCLLPDGTVISCTPSGDCDVNSKTSAGTKLEDQQQIAIIAGFIDQRIKATESPDLVPLPTPASTPPGGFCRRNDQGQLLVKIFNQGRADAPASTTRVQFGTTPVTEFNINTPALAFRGSTELVINIPNGCFDANNNCAFTIGADAAQEAAESNETNNDAAGLCGPQFQ